jgi:YgiT-type zinc finger domain-containing protein
MKKYVSKCPICGGEVVRKKVKKVVRGGDDVAILEVEAGICLKCGERVYSKETQEKFQQIRDQLRSGSTKTLKRVGNTYMPA